MEKDKFSSKREKTDFNFVFNFAFSFVLCCFSSMEKCKTTQQPLVLAQTIHQRLKLTQNSRDTDTLKDFKIINIDKS